MSPRSPKSIELYSRLLEGGFPAQICELICSRLNTDYTAQRMLGYLNYFPSPRLEDLADEMVAILNDRSLIAEKHEYFRTNGEWNMYLNYGFGTEDEDE